MPVEATVDTLLGALLMFLAISVAFADVVQFENISAKENAGKLVAMAGTAERVTVNFLENSTPGQGIAPDVLLQLASVPGDPNPAPPQVTYSQYLTETGLKGVGLSLDIAAPLTVTSNVTQGGITVSVTQAFGGTPVAAAVKMYVFNGTAVLATIQGQASLDGKFFATYTLPSGAVAVTFANAGNSVGYDAVNGTGGELSDGPMYVQTGVMKGILALTYLFAFEGWLGPLTAGDAVNVSGYHLPVLLVYQLPDGSYSATTYPRLPYDFGSHPAAGTDSTIFLVDIQVASSILIMRLQAWVTGP